MSLFDIFKGKSVKEPRAASERPKSADKADKEVARYADAISKRAQNYDRQEAIDALAKIASVEAAALLLKRFSFQVDPSITDQEEKETAFRGVVRAGEGALPAVIDSCPRAESVTWQLRIMREILSEDAFIAQVTGLLAKWDTEYDRNADPKVQLISALEELRDPRIRTATERFLGDVHEPTRYHAVSTLLAQDDPEIAAPLALALVREEALRTKNRIAEGLASRAWMIPLDEREAVARALPRGFRLDESGVVLKY